MQFLSINELYSVLKNEKMVSLWSFLDSEHANFISNNDKSAIKKIINKFNYQHHNDGNFFNNLKEIFTEEGNCYLKEGQEDIGAISLNNSVVIVRQSDFGVGLNVIQIDDNDINLENWSNYKKIISLLEIGFINAKDFHSVKFFDNLNNELQKNSSTNDRKAKI